MRTIIAGSRTIHDYAKVVDAAVRCGWTITEVVSGTANGVDKLGESWAIINKVPIKRFPAKWQLLGKQAGYIRNQEMADYAEALIAIWDGKSKGVKSIHMANKRNIKRLIKHLKKIPNSRFNQDNWCGAQCCVGGHAALLAKIDKGFIPVAVPKGTTFTDNGGNETSDKEIILLVKAGKLSFLRKNDVASMARKFLGLKSAEARHLFRSSWDGPLSKKEKIKELEEFLK